MNMKGVILGVTGALAVTGVQAADLPAAPEPVDYVRVCDAFGAGFLYIPGTETCFKLAGRVRADYRVALAGAKFGGVSWDKASVPGYNFRARAYFYQDSRTNTEYGLLRTYTQLEIQTQTSNPGSAVNLDQAYIQFGGLTAGKYYSFFNFYQSPSFFAPFEAANSDYNTLGLAYTYAFGNGFSASLSIEDSTFSELYGIKRAAPNVGPNVFVNRGYAAAKMPDIVANLRVDQGWGSAQIMGVVDEVRSLANGVQTKTGWALGGGVTVNLPMLGEGDNFGLQAAYSSGKIGIIAPNAWHPGGVADAVVSANGSMKLSSSWAIDAGFQHFWTPQIASGVGFSYLDVDNTGKRFDFQNWDVQTQLTYTPVAGLMLGGELQYKQTTPGGNGKDLDALVGTFRIERTF